MNRRSFLRSLFASTAAIVVAPADIFEDLPPAPGDPHRTHIDMGRATASLDGGSVVIQGGAGTRTEPGGVVTVTWEYPPGIWRLYDGAPAFPMTFNGTRSIFGSP